MFCQVQHRGFKSSLQWLAVGFLLIDKDIDVVFCLVSSFQSICTFTQNAGRVAEELILLSIFFKKHFSTLNAVLWGWLALSILNVTTWLFPLAKNLLVNLSCYTHTLFPIQYCLRRSQSVSNSNTAQSTPRLFLSTFKLNIRDRKGKCGGRRGGKKGWKTPPGQQEKWRQVLV